MKKHSPVSQTEPLTHSQQQQTLRKITWYLIPWLSVLYLMAVLDRANLGNARLFLIEGPIIDSNHTNCNFTTSNCSDNPVIRAPGIITDDEYGLAVGVFYVGYMIFEVPSNLLLKKTSAPTWLARIMVSWGIVTICSMFIDGGVSLIICRFILGAAEAGFFPGVLYYLSNWFTPQERAIRIGLFYLTSPCSGVIGGLLSYGIFQMDGLGGLKGWQWLFLLEGIPSVILGSLTWFILPNRPEDCTFLNEHEKSWVVNSLKTPQNDGADPNAISMTEVLEVFKSWRVWLFALLSISSNVMGAVVSFFIPSIINQFGFDPLTSNLLSAPPFFFGVICIILNSYHSDYTKERPLHLLIPFALQMIGWGLVGVCYYYVNNLALQYTVLLLTVGVHYTFPPIFWAWLTQELKGDTTIATSTALVASVGTLAQIFTPSMTTYINEETGSYMWVTVSLSAFGLFGLIVGFVLYFLLRKYPFGYEVVNEEDFTMKKKNTHRA